MLETISEYSSFFILNTVEGRKNGKGEKKWPKGEKLAEGKMAEGRKSGQGEKKWQRGEKPSRNTAIMRGENWQRGEKMAKGRKNGQGEKKWPRGEKMAKGRKNVRN